MAKKTVEKKQKSGATSRDKEHKAITAKLEARVKKLEAALESAEAKAAQWKKKAKKDRADAAASSAKASKLEKKLDKARRSVPKASVGVSRPTLAVAPDAPAQPDEVAPPVEVVEVETPVESAPSAASKAGPDDSWTVTALRAEARARGIAGYSRKSKAELIAALS